MTIDLKSRVTKVFCIFLCLLVLYMSLVYPLAQAEVVTLTLVMLGLAIFGVCGYYVATSARDITPADESLINRFFDANEAAMTWAQRCINTGIATVTVPIIQATADWLAQNAGQGSVAVDGSLTATLGYGMSALPETWNHLYIASGSTATISVKMNSYSGSWFLGTYTSKDSYRCGFSTISFTFDGDTDILTCNGGTNYYLDGHSEITRNPSTVAINSTVYVDGVECCDLGKMFLTASSSVVTLQLSTAFGWMYPFRCQVAEGDLPSTFYWIKAGGINDFVGTLTAEGFDGIGQDVIPVFNDAKYKTNELCDVIGRVGTADAETGELSIPLNIPQSVPISQTDVLTGEVVSELDKAQAGTGEQEGTKTETKEEDIEKGKLTPLVFTKFPFCLPWDLYAAFAVLRSDPVTPVIHIPFDLAISGTTISDGFDLNLGWLDPVVVVLRWFLLLAFIYALILVTQRVIRW